MPQQRTWTARRWSRKALQALVIAGLTLLMLEGWLRLLGLRPPFLNLLDKEIRLSEDPILGYELNPEHPEISAQGLRDREYAVPKKDGVFRIVALGDSITFGCCYYRGRATYAKRLERALNRATHKGAFEVINAGVSGYNTLQEATLFAQRLSRFEPDLILLQFTGNDFLSLTSSEAWENMKHHFSKLEGRGPERLAAARMVFDSARGAGRWLAQARVYQFAIYAYSRFGPAATTAEDVDIHRLSRAGEISQEGDSLNWQRSSVVAEGFDLLSRSAGDTPVLVVFFPRLDNLEQPPFADFFDYGRTLASARGFDTLDLTDCFKRHTFDGAPPFHDGDNVHPNEWGHKVAATCIAHRLNPDLPDTLGHEKAVAFWDTMQPKRTNARKRESR